MKEKKQQPTTSKKSSHNNLDWVEKELMEVRAFDMGSSLKDSQNYRLLFVNHYLPNWIKSDPQSSKLV